MDHLKTGHSKWITEKIKVKEYLMFNNATATMCAVALKIYRPNLCRHKAELEKEGYLKETHKGMCKVTGFKAAYLLAFEEPLQNPQLRIELV
ncbi:hypothetical protein [Pedobacter sp.]|uniref:hypothetical protein n=1 Tax=Pedobacter sp. TaxID=1411316 RepID=UPI003C52990E